MPLTFVVSPASDLSGGWLHIDGLPIYGRV